MIFLLTAAVFVLKVCWNRQHNNYYDCNQLDTWYLLLDKDIVARWWVTRQ